jgi:hypothetical protein
MRPFQFLDMSALLDMLAYVTSRYTKLYSGDMNYNDFIACRELLELLQTEVTERKKVQLHQHSDKSDSSINLSA